MLVSERSTLYFTASRGYRFVMRVGWGEGLFNMSPFRVCCVCVRYVFVISEFDILAYNQAAESLLKICHNYYKFGDKM